MYGVYGGESYHRLSKVLEHNERYRNDILKLPRYYKSNEGMYFVDALHH